MNVSAITYDESSFDTITQVRLEIGDTRLDAGPRPKKYNFSDEAITQILSDESTVGRAAARLCEILAAEWAAYPVDSRMGPMGETKRASASFRDQATRLREQHGYPEATQDGFTINVQPGRVS